MTVKTIGLTGGIGSGKSFISKIFKLLDIPVYNSDENAKLLMTENKGLKDNIIKLLGKKSYSSDGQLNRKFISDSVFNNVEILAKLNGIVHPAVRKDFNKFVSEHKYSAYVINEAALFVENGSHKDFDYLITVVAPVDLRIERVMERDQVSKDEVLLRMSNQSSDEEKKEKSQFLIYNDITENLFSQISNIHRKLVK